MTDWSTHPDALALLDFARAAPFDPLARNILADWLVDNGQRGMASLLKLSLRAPDQIHHASKKLATCLPGIVYAVDGWLLGGKEALLGRNNNSLPWLNGLHLSGRGLGTQAQADLLKALPTIWSPGWRVFSLADFTIPADSFTTSLERGWARNITHMRLGGPFACSLVLATLTRTPNALNTLELRSAWWREEKASGQSAHGGPALPPPLEFGKSAPLLPLSIRKVSLENFSLPRPELACFLETLASAGAIQLRLNQCHFNPHALATFNQSTIWNHLESLNLTGCRLPKAQPAKEETPLQPISANRIRSLTLRACSLTGHSLKTLAECGWLSGPTRIDLSQNHLGDLDARALEGILDAGSIESLNLSGCVVNGERLGQWLALGPWERLGQLNLAFNPLGEEGWIQIANGQQTPALQWLDASSTHATGKGLDYFANGNLFPRLGRLTIRGNNPGIGRDWPDSIRALLRHPASSSLAQFQFDAGHEWIRQELAHPECRLGPGAREHLLRMAELRDRDESRRAKEHEEELNRHLLHTMGEQTGIFARWASQQRRIRENQGPSELSGAP